MTDRLNPIPGNNPTPLQNALFSEEILTSFNGTFQLVLQETDGNLVLQINDPNTNPNANMINGPMWDANTGGAGGVAILQDDGNFVVYGNEPGDPNDAAFQTGTFGRFPFTGFLIVQDDGNLVIYDSDQITPIWSSGTNAKGKDG
jgi:hypothetical protein